MSGIPGALSDIACRSSILGCLIIGILFGKEKFRREIYGISGMISIYRFYGDWRDGKKNKK